MLNYQQLSYDVYYLENENGDFIRCSKRECFAKAEKPTEENPWKQRWYYDPDQSMAIRLARTEKNHELHKLNQASLKQLERVRDKDSECVWSGTAHCDQICGKCQFGKSRRLISFNKAEEDGTTQESLGILMDQVPLEAYHRELKFEAKLLLKLSYALNDLTESEVGLLKNLYSEEKTTREYGKELGISHQAVSKRNKKLIEKLRVLMEVKD